MQKPLKILVVRFSSIGDIVLTSPIVRCLKQQLSAEVHFITKDIYECHISYFFIKIIRLHIFHHQQLKMEDQK